MYDLSLKLLGRVQQSRSKQQFTNTGQSMYSPFKLSAHQGKIFVIKVLLKRKGKMTTITTTKTKQNTKKTKQKTKTHRQNSPPKEGI